MRHDPESLVMDVHLQISTPCNILNAPKSSRLLQSIIVKPQSTFHSLRESGSDCNPPQPCIPNSWRLDKWLMDVGSLVIDVHCTIYRYCKFINIFKDSCKVLRLLHFLRDNSINNLSRPIQLRSSYNFSQPYNSKKSNIINSFVVSRSLVMDVHL
jgi:hypothetical protein